MGGNGAVEVSMQWSAQMGLSKEAVDTLWERAATRALEFEDRGEKYGPLDIWKGLHEDHPKLYPANLSPTYLNKWWHSTDFQEYLSIRRQEHIIRTMPVRMQVDKYYSHIMEKAGAELFQRLATSPEDFSTAQLLKIMSDSANIRAMVDKDMQAAKGEGKSEGAGKVININAFQFVEKLPPQERAAALAYLAKSVSEPIIEGEANDDD